MSGRGERTAGAPGVPGPRGGAPRCSAADREAHRPVSAWTAADAAPAARSNRGDKARAAGAVSTSTFATVTREVAPLDLHEGIGDPRTGCPRWPERMALRNDATGELRPGRCRATNLCSYCQTLYVVETVEMLTLDALRCAPTLWLALTAREHLTRGECRDHLRQLRRAARKRWPVEWFVHVEFQRRGALHLNLLVKGVPASDCPDLADLLFERWCERVDAKRIGQWADVVNDGHGVTRYISKSSRMD
jgi:hypothetical protein